MNDYIRIARIDHWFKNLFMLPGFALAFLLTEQSLFQSLPAIFIALLSTCLLASANYVINEWLDAEFDAHHPVKRSRPSVAGNIAARYVYLEYGALAAAGLALAMTLPREFVLFSVVFLVMGIIYNVRPLRAKDRVYLDAFSESINNPLRLLLGWSALLPGVLPPSSILLAYWLGGAFLMTVKRYAEYRFLANQGADVALYRKSFARYSEKKLLLASFFYALSSAFFLGIFLIKYRIEFLLTFPLFAVLFSWYLYIGMKPASPVQNPEKLYHERGFVLYVVFLCVTVGVLFVYDIPWLGILTEKVVYK